MGINANVRMCVYPVFYSCDLDLNPMTLTHELDLRYSEDVLAHLKVKFLCQDCQTLEQERRQTHTHTD